MEKCEKCGAEVSHDDIYEDNGLKVCEDCKLEGITPPELHPYFSRVKKTDPETPKQ
ncbi:hypothetical protein [Dehalobacterium formicoaceticum]|uniref:TFIIB-type domain-containing protein n=1 Tax=Dehalobacterium formicoaceticum TaxID=51515 RepID=A0ABT1Y657_9FIRM|nr:hypothetical protein [Dehalobacterium formicoaceticum]MCR6546365.1 hypothetical protein [Dehalobacterium formicoaceticum]